MHLVLCKGSQDRVAFPAGFLLRGSWRSVLGVGPDTTRPRPTGGRCAERRRRSAAVSAVFALCISSQLLDILYRPHSSHRLSYMRTRPRRRPENAPPPADRVAPAAIVPARRAPPRPPAAATSPVLTPSRLLTSLDVSSLVVIPQPPRPSQQHARPQVTCIHTPDSGAGSSSFIPQANAEEREAHASRLVQGSAPHVADRRVVQPDVLRRVQLAQRPPLCGRGADAI